MVAHYNKDEDSNDEPLCLGSMSDKDTIAFVTAVSHKLVAGITDQLNRVLMTSLEDSCPCKDSQLLVHTAILDSVAKVAASCLANIASIHKDLPDNQQIHRDTSKEIFINLYEAINSIMNKHGVVIEMKKKRGEP